MRQDRGIPIDGKDFVYGWYFERAGATYIIPITDKYHTPASFVLTFVQVIPETVGQSTGLKDKNKEAYSGDLIDVKDGLYGAGGVVEWKNKSGLWIWRATDTHNSMTIADNQTIPLWVILDKHYRYKGEIIGNIHQPELSEKQ